MGHKIYRPGHKRESVGRTHNLKANGRDMYDYQWQKYRKRFLAVNKECYSCGEPATVVDHLVKHRGNVELFKKLDNHIQLCESCHNTLTALFDKKNKPYQEKIKWMNDNRLKWGVTVRVKVLGSYSSDDEG